MQGFIRGFQCFFADPISHFLIFVISNNNFESTSLIQSSYFDLFSKLCVFDFVNAYVDYGISYF